jgi:thiamine biosynthesis protein ThiS
MAVETTIRVKINGKEEEIRKGQSVVEVLRERDIRPEMVAVELNGLLLEKDEYSKVLQEGDELEYLYYMAGGNIELIV